jgi:hypothetical protein
MPEISYIVNSDKPYPAWIKSHRVFKSLSKIDKIFPRIGLPNFTEQIVVYPTESVKANARQVVRFALSEFALKVQDLKTKLAAELTVNGRERNEKCNATQSAINIINALLHSCSNKELTSIIEGKVGITLPCDVFSGASSTPVFKKGEAFFKVLNKINLVLNEIIPGYKINYEADMYFKEYSKLNLPSKELTMTFASTGPEGAWDIATASMRGIASCQTWTAAQSRGLIGSISSKYVGIVYVSGTTDYPPYGKQMMFRTLIRLVVNRNTGAPVLYMDSMYPSYNPDIYAAFKAIIEARSGLKVYSANAGDAGIDGVNVTRDYHLLNEVSRTYLREGEYSYMDTKINVEDRKTPILFDVENKVLSDRRAYLTTKLEKVISDKREAYIKHVKELKEYLASDMKDESKKPEIASAFEDLKKGQYAFQNMLNFFTHCERAQSTTNKPTSYFLLEIFKALGNSETKFASNKECDVWILRNLINNHDAIKEKSWAVLEGGSWTKSFPASAKRFHETVLNDLKKELLLSCKGA